MKAPYKLLAIALITLTLSCCKRDDDQPMQYHTLLLPQEIKDYLLFKPGTYWVYQNSKTMELDSVFVTAVDTSMGNATDNNANISVDYQKFYLETYSDFEQYYNRYRFYEPFAGNAIKPDFHHNIKKSKTRPGDFIGETYFFVTPNEVGNIGYQDVTGGTLILLAKKDTIINGNVCLDTYIYDNNIDVSENEHHLRYYISRGVGVVRKSIIDQDESWELLRYHIEQ